MKYRKKPVVIEAFKWTGGPDQTEDPEWAVEAIKTGVMKSAQTLGTTECLMLIDTLEGTMRANRGDYIIRGVKGEIYPCKPDIFEATYGVVCDGKTNCEKVCDEILEIMATYHAQEESTGVDTPGGLEHMGDVWRLFRKWEMILKD